jgi:hypothetical protein
MLRGLSSYVSTWGSRVLQLLSDLSRITSTPVKPWVEPARILPTNTNLSQPAMPAHRNHKAVVWKRAMPRHVIKT